MGDPVDELAFLSRSKHRVRVLRALREPCDRSTLRDRTDASKPTLSRALSEFEDRAWMTRTGEGYHLTQLGSLVVERLDAVIASLETVERLNPIAEWLPDEGFEFDLDRLHGATVRAGSPTDSLGVLRRLGTVLYEADTVHLLTGTVASAGIDLHRRAIQDHGQTLDVIVTAEAVRTIRSDPEMTEFGAELQGTDGVSIVRYDGTVPYLLTVTEDRVLIGLLDETGTIRGLVESDDPSVRRWADDRWSDYRADSVEAEPFDR
jgi:predicted transcriptional regulator